LAQDAQNLKDEIDILKHTSDKVEKLESTIDAYKIKLEEMADLRKQIKMSEENNTKYLEKIIILEEEVKKISTLKAQIDNYKKQIQELHEKVLVDDMKMKKLEYEHKSVEEKCNELKNEKERLRSEHQHLKEMHEQLQLNAQLSQAANIIRNDYFSLFLSFSLSLRFDHFIIYNRGQQSKSNRREHV
jgi:chromosome segregation ATPase